MIYPTLLLGRLGPSLLSFNLCLIDSKVISSSLPHSLPHLPLFLIGPPVVFSLLPNFACTSPFPFVKAPLLFDRLFLPREITTSSGYHFLLLVVLLFSFLFGPTARQKHGGRVFFFYFLPSPFTLGKRSSLSSRFLSLVWFCFLLLLLGLVSPLSLPV